MGGRQDIEYVHHTLAEVMSTRPLDSRLLRSLGLFENWLVEMQGKLRFYSDLATCDEDVTMLCDHTATDGDIELP